MKFNINLLKKWIKPGLDGNKLVKKLTFSGFESYIEKNNIIITIPYNRNNCTSLFGVCNTILNIPYIESYFLKTTFKNYIKIIIKNSKFCPLFYGIIIKNINTSIKTPFYITEVLLNNNINLINSIVDTINYVTIITGQPLHAYDLDNIHGHFIITKTDKNESMLSLNNQKIKFYPNTPIIKDHKKIIALPGIIGSYNTRINNATKNIFLESAYFDSTIIKNILKMYNIRTYSSNLFENILNLKFVKFSLIYASYLINKIHNSVFSNVVEKTIKKNIPKNKFLNLYRNKLNNILGYTINNYDINNILLKLDFNFKKYKEYWKINIPFYRKDILIEENIIAEIMKIYGYENIPSLPLKLEITSKEHTEINIKNIEESINFLIHKGFFEIINYSFVNNKIEDILHPKVNLILLKNPMSQKMNVMRSSLLQGLLKVAQYNLNRGHEDISLFEIGNIFYKDTIIITKKIISGICTEQFIYKKINGYNDINFFVIKNLVEQILNILFNTEKIKFYKSNENYLNKNLSTNFYLNNIYMGNFGLIEKNILNIFSIKQNLYFFQIYLNNNFNNKYKKLKKISRYPKIKRDISIILKHDITYEFITLYIYNLKINIMIEMNLLDIYFFDNKNKSITLRLFFQSIEKTLLDKEINFIIIFLQEKIKKKFKAIIKV